MTNGKDGMMEMEQPYYVRSRPDPIPFHRFVYNPQTNTVLGRGAASWAKIGIFYTVFYGVLATLVAICMWVFFQTLDPRIPKWQLEESLIGTNPGLGFRPHPSEDNVESTLIWYKGTKYENFKHWKEALDEFLKEYKTPGITTGRGQNIHDCSFRQPAPPEGSVCNVNIRDFMDCSQEQNYGYHTSSPCIFLKLNKIYGWIPEYYNKTADLPAKMPKQLREIIAGEEVETPYTLNTVWVSCEGENPADIENMGPIAYYPRQGFPGYYYPYKNSEGYLSPLIAVHFKRPNKGIIINIECKAWAKNIIHDRKERLGSVHFEIMID